VGLEEMGGSLSVGRIATVEGLNRFRDPFSFHQPCLANFRCFYGFKTNLKIMLNAYVIYRLV